MFDVDAHEALTGVEFLAELVREKVQVIVGTVPTTLRTSERE